MTGNVLRHANELRSVSCDPARAPRARSGTAATLAGLVNFLQLPLDEAKLERAVEHSSFDNLKAQEEESGFKEARSDGMVRFFRAGVSGGWTKYLKDHHVQALIESNGVVMTRLGYLGEDGSLRE